jgi:predicted transcriptional regulator
MAGDMLLDHVADIVAAHVSNNAVPQTDLPVLIRLVHGSLAALGNAPSVTEEERSPAVPIRSSVKPNAITCLECGARLKMLKRHLATDHLITPAQYRARWALPASYPMVAPDYAEKRKEFALRVGLGRKPGQSAPSERLVDSVSEEKTAPETAEAPGGRLDGSTELDDAAASPQQDTSA